MKKPILGILLCFIFFLINGVVLVHQGVRRGGDSIRYESGSQNLLEGIPLEGKQRSYPGYIAVVAFSRWIGMGINGVIAVHLILSAIAAIALYGLGSKISGPLTGFFASLFYLANPDIAQWNTYVLTDSLYISAVIIVSWAIHQARARGGLWYIAASMLVLAAATIRPNGHILIPIAGLYWAVAMDRRKRIYGIILLLMILVSIAILSVSPALKTSLSAESPYQMLLEGEVIWGYEGWRLAMPHHGGSGDEGLMALGSYILQHPIAVIRLAIYRVGACLIHLRPYYSFQRNLVLFFFVAPLYALAIYSTFHLKRNQMSALLKAVIGGHFFIVALTFADWDGRFLLYVLPLIGIFSAYGLERIISPWLVRLSKKIGDPQKDALK